MPFPWTTKMYTLLQYWLGSCSICLVTQEDPDCYHFMSHSCLNTSHSQSFFKSHLEREKKEIISLSTAVTFIVATNKFLIRKVFSIKASQHHNLSGLPIQPAHYTLQRGELSSKIFYTLTFLLPSSKIKTKRRKHFFMHTYFFFSSQSCKFWQKLPIHHQ